MVNSPQSARALEADPQKADFVRTYEAGRAQVVRTVLVADLETPVSAFLKLGNGRKWSFLLESVEGGSVRGRYSIIGFEPDLVWQANGDVAEVQHISDDGTAGPSESTGLNTLASLRALLRDSAIDLPPGLPPMAAGIFGYMGYDMVRLVEHLPDVNEDQLGVPDGILVRPRLMVIFDSVKDEMQVVTPVYPKAGTNAGEAYAKALARLAAVVDALDAPLPHASDLPSGRMPPPEPMSNTTPATYRANVEKGKEYIAAGDAFQIVLSQRFSAPFKLPPFSLYRALRRTNPSPFLFFLDFGDFAIAGSSPEILVRLRDGELTLRPLAGTRRRGATPDEDKALEAELLADPKERAEHLMLLDLGRNDVGRVAKIGSVAVTASFEIERYSQVMHISSNVVGELDAKKHDAIDALMAAFPAGTLSGAPKVRAMEIIDELETVKRGPYAGCVGYFSADGNMDTCIVLRTAIIKDGVMYVQAGAGVVADSDPQAEQMECVYKARALFKAAEEAVRFASRARR